MGPRAKKVGKVLWALARIAANWFIRNPRSKAIKDAVEQVVKEPIEGELK